MSQLTVIATIRARAGKEDEVLEGLRGLIAPTRAEAGCLRYDLHQDDEDPAHFMFHETWASRDSWQTHMKAQHLRDCMSATEDAIETFTLNEMTRRA